MAKRRISKANAPHPTSTTKAASPPSQTEISDPLPKELIPLVVEIASKLGCFSVSSLTKWLCRREGASELVKLLRKRIPIADIATPGDKQQGWEWLGNYYRFTNRFHEALGIYNALYWHMLLYEQETGQRTHKGMPLVWMSVCHAALGHMVHVKRYLMLTLCEDAIRGQGKIDYQGGPYFRLVWHFGLPHQAFVAYSRQAFEFHKRHPALATFPERVLAELDQEWMIEVPSHNESNRYYCNTAYVKWLLSKLGTDAGKPLEFLAHYLVSLIPGCRACVRRRSRSTDYDVVGLLEGPALDFRSEVGRYFVCECKDWSIPADFTSLAKFGRVLDSVKSRFGILFSSEGISGSGRSTDAERELFKVYADRGIVIVVVDRNDLENVSEGANFFAMLRTKYEEIRLDLRPPSKGTASLRQK
jgi:hypothetical protein